MNRDPFGPWPAARRWLWAALVGVLALVALPGFARALRGYPPPTDPGLRDALRQWGQVSTWLARPEPPVFLDFFQEWASARNYHTGLPIYTDHRVTLERHLGGRWPDDEPLYLQYNSHPPTSVLLVLPLGRLGYMDALLVWNLLSLAALVLSLGLIVRQLGIVFAPWSLLPLAALLLIFHPLRNQINQGQLNLVLLLLLTGTWAADRSGRPGMAGVLLGLATTVKLFPGFLFLYFLGRKRWRAVATGVLTVAACTGLTALVLGPDAYRDYVQVVVPHGAWGARDWWDNASLVGFWTKLFDARSGQVEPLWYHPTLASAATAACGALVVAVVWWVVRRTGGSRTSPQPGEHDLAFAVAVTGMLLVNPSTLDHYFLLLLVPLAVVWVWLPASGWLRGLFALLVVSLSLNSKTIWSFALPGIQQGPGGGALPVHTLGVLSYPFYTLVGLFVLAVFLARQSREDRFSSSPPGAWPGTDGAASGTGKLPLRVRDGRQPCPHSPRCV